MSKQKQTQDERERPGDVLGLGNPDPGVRIPVTGRRDHRAVAGIEVGDRATGITDVPQRNGGVSGADLGGFEGAKVRPEPVRNRDEDEPTD